MYNFNPRSHEGSDFGTLSLEYNPIISIHAPTRGATPTPHTRMLQSQFQSTLPRGERLNWRLLCIQMPLFQSTLPRGERPAFGHSVAVVDDIFQSTLPRGERHDTNIRQARSHYFNPRSHEGSDWHLPMLSRENLIFQSTLPRGERRLADAWPDQVANFNPRSHEGSDERTVTQIHLLFLISIHAPTRGATR